MKQVADEQHVITHYHYFKDENHEITCKHVKAKKKKIKIEDMDHGTDSYLNL